MRCHVLASALALSSVFAFGCSGASEPDENTRGATEALVAGVPKAAWLEIAPARLDGGGETETKSEPPSLACAPLQTLAPLADLTHTVSTRANGILGGVLGIVGALLTRPPTEVEGQHAVWGPLSGSEPAGIYVFEAERLSDGAIAYKLHGAAKDGDPMLDLFAGATRLVGADRHAGKVQINLEALHAVDPIRNQAVTGTIAVDYGNLDGVTIAMAFAGASGPETPPTDAQYTYARRSDGSGTFTFVAHSAEQKLLRVQSAWNEAGAGKSSATELTSQSAMIQCWAPNGAMIFAADPVTGATQGDAACCPQ
jgi:hypothetical protein